jgi:hypothetical protein
MTEQHEKVLRDIGRALFFVGVVDALVVFLLGFALIEIRTFLAPYFIIAGLFLYFRRISAVRAVLASAKMLIAAIPFALIGVLIIQPISLTVANLELSPLAGFTLFLLWHISSSFAGLSRSLQPP